MIKGINMQVVEVKDTGCDYFERIMFFVKPEYVGISEGKIRDRAGIIAGNACTAPPTKVKTKRLGQTLRIVLALLTGICVGLMIAAVSSQL